jgi:hypothetical protein
MMKSTEVAGLALTSPLERSSAPFFGVRMQSMNLVNPSLGAAVLAGLLLCTATLTYAEARSASERHPTAQDERSADQT